jgi:hypothetical protein
MLRQSKAAAILMMALLTVSACAPAGTVTPDSNARPILAEGWQAFKADSGYEIRYPLEQYSIRNAPSSPEVLYPGVKVIEPNDASYYAEPRVVTYKISIAVTPNTQGLSLDDPAQLLAHSAIYSYDSGVLAGHDIREVTLDGVKALRVDDLEVGPAGVTAQIVTIRNDRIYELLVEPHQITGNLAVPFQVGEASPENEDLFEAIIATFRFSE